MRYISVMLVSLLAILSGCSSPAAKNEQPAAAYQPDDKALYDTIVKLDSLFFHAYNTCYTALETYASFFSEDIEFYHDKGGLMTSKNDIVEATRRNVCGKVSRELVKGSIEVYPIKDFGAVEIGLHKFHNNEEPPGTPSQAGRFTIIWKHTDGQWKITRVISLH